MSIYTQSIPNSGESLGSTRVRIHDNFEKIFSVQGINHVDFNEADEGKHKFMQMPEQVAAPSTAVNEGALYTKDDGTQTALYWREENNGAEVQMTFGPPTIGATGQTFLPGGLLMKWGVTASNGPTTFVPPFPNNLFNVQVTIWGHGSDSLSTVANTPPPDVNGFSVGFAGAPTVGYYWMAIGN